MDLFPDNCFPSSLWGIKGPGYIKKANLDCKFWKTLYESPHLNVASVSAYIMTIELEVKAHYYEIQELSSILLLLTFY